MVGLPQIFFRNQTSLVNLQLLRNEKKVDQVVYGREYILRADMSQPDGKEPIGEVKLCTSLFILDAAT